MEYHFYGLYSCVIIPIPCLLTGGVQASIHAAGTAETEEHEAGKPPPHLQAVGHDRSRHEGGTPRFHPELTQHEWKAGGHQSR